MPRTGKTCESTDRNSIGNEPFQDSTCARRVVEWFILSQAERPRGNADGGLGKGCVP